MVDNNEDIYIRIFESLLPGAGFALDFRRVALSIYARIQDKMAPWTKAGAYNNCYPYDFLLSFFCSIERAGFYLYAVLKFNI